MVLSNYILFGCLLHGIGCFNARDWLLHCTGLVALMHGIGCYMNAVGYEWYGLRGG